MAKQGLALQQKLSQRLSPQQIQTIRLLEVPSMDLQTYLRKELEENPVLDIEPQNDDEERIDDGEYLQSPTEVPLDKYKEDDSVPYYNLTARNWGKDPREEYDTFAVKEDFRDALLEQLRYRDLSDHEAAIAAFLVQSLDDNGYLTRDELDLVDDLSFHFAIDTDEDEIRKMIVVLQGLEPVGIGARNLRECLLLQLKSREQTPTVALATSIIENCYQDFATRNFANILTRIKADKDDIREALELVSHLNPSPGGYDEDTYADKSRQVSPDFLIQIVDGELKLTMPKVKIPELRINHTYSQIIEDAAAPGASKEQKDAAVFIKQKIDSARNLVEAVRQRQTMLQKTMQTIIDFQHDYFLDMDESNLRPMVLKDIAEITGNDISTVSRVANSKYVETPSGIFPLKYFFSEGLENAAGEEVSTRELKKALQEIVDNEDKAMPLSDEQLVEAMSGRGYILARRTVAKYRDQLRIPAARLRKEI